MARVILIAECSTSHGGSLDLALEFVETFAPVAQFVKFQYTRVAHLRKTDPQYEWFTKAELPDAAFLTLRDACRRAGTELLLTVFNAQDVPFVASLGLPVIKIGSGEGRDERLRQAVLKASPGRLWVSRGLNPNTYARNARIDQFRCVTRYPAPLAYSAAVACQHYIKPVIGWSDHCVGLDVAKSAIVSGARLIEKHVKVRQQARPGQPWEATVEDMAELRAFADDDPEARYLGRWQQ